MAADGASIHERLLAAARDDNEELIQEVFDEGDFDINFQDGLGNTALHYAVANGSLDVLEHILCHDQCDVDLTNKIEGATPLHLIFLRPILLEDRDVQIAVLKELLDAGANPRIKDKNGDTFIDLIPSEDAEIKDLVRTAEAEEAISKDDIAHDYDDDDDEDDEGSGSASE